MLDHLPDLLDPFEFAEKNRRTKGTLALSGMDRLRDAILNPDAAATIDLEFKREGRIAAITGRIDVDLVLRCQCCLEPLDWPVRGAVNLAVVRSIDEAMLLSEEFEPLVVEVDQAVALADIVQDELLLALPDVPRHEIPCRPPQPTVAAEAAKNPFAVLAQLKKNPS